MYGWCKDDGASDLFSGALWQGVTRRRQKTRNYVCIEENFFFFFDHEVVQTGCRASIPGDTQNPIGHCPLPPAVADIPSTKEAGIDNT